MQHMGVSIWCGVAAPAACSAVPACVKILLWLYQGSAAAGVLGAERGARGGVLLQQGRGRAERARLIRPAGLALVFQQQERLAKAQIEKCASEPCGGNACAATRCRRDTIL